MYVIKEGFLIASIPPWSGVIFQAYAHSYLGDDGTLVLLCMSLNKVSYRHLPHSLKAQVESARNNGMSRLLLGCRVSWLQIPEKGMTKN